MSELVNSFQSLMNDHTSGSSELLKKTVIWILAALKKQQNAEKILEGIRKLSSEHSSMAVLYNLSRSFEKSPLTAAKIKAWLETYQTHEAAACEHFAKKAAVFKNVLVHSNSGLLTTALSAVETPLNIFCTEGRPAYEGRIIAERLSNTKHRIYLITDIAAFSVIRRVEILAFGCDAITRRGFVNKIGTASLAEAAQMSGKKSYFIGTTEKKIAGWTDEFLLRQGPSDEIYHGNKNIHIENYYYDLTPFESASGTFLEDGLHTDHPL
jgi:translation initiation factor 2B subunit (eIF-2B alpha/beta/delta family)